MLFHFGEIKSIRVEENSEGIHDSLLGADTWNSSQLHSRQFAHHVAFAHLLEHLAHLRVLAQKIVDFLHGPS